MRLINPIIEHDIRADTLARRKWGCACLLESLTRGRMDAVRSYYVLNLQTLFDEIRLTLTRQGMSMK